MSVSGTKALCHCFTTSTRSSRTSPTPQPRSASSTSGQALASPPLTRSRRLFRSRAPSPPDDTRGFRPRCQPSSRTLRAPISSLSDLGGGRSEVGGAGGAREGVGGTATSKTARGSLGRAEAEVEKQARARGQLRRDCRSITNPRSWDATTLHNERSIVYSETPFRALDRLQRKCAYCAKVYSYKEIENIGMKKGVNGQTIKDVLKSLTDDSLVDFDKIGSGNFYWALPSKDGQRKRARLDSLKKEFSLYKAKKAAAENKVASLREERVDSKQRQELLKSVPELKKEEQALRAELKKFEDRDPTVLAALTKAAVSKMAQATRWGENIGALADWIVEKKHMTVQEAFQGIGATENDVEQIDFEYFRDLSADST